MCSASCSMILSKVFLREQITFSSCFLLDGGLIDDVLTKPWLTSFGKLAVTVDYFCWSVHQEPLSPFVLVTIEESYSILQILLLGKATLLLDGNLLSIMYRCNLSLFSKYLAYVRTNLNKYPYLYFYGTQLLQIYYYSV